MSHACEFAGISRQTAYRVRKEDAAFREAWEDASETLTDELEQTLIRRAIDGWDEPVFHQGLECGAKRKFDNELGWRFLRSRRRDIYNPKTGDTGGSADEAKDLVTKLLDSFAAMDASLEGPPAATPPDPDTDAPVDGGGDA